MNLGDLYRKICPIVNLLWINLTGRKVKSDKGNFRAICYFSQCLKIFGIGSPDEVDLKITFKNAKMLKIGDRLEINHSKWSVFNIQCNFNFVIVTCVMYIESKCNGTL